MWYISFIPLLFLNDRISWLQWKVTVVILWWVIRRRYNEVTLWLSCDRHLETPLLNRNNSCLKLVSKWHQNEVSGDKSFGDLSQSNAHGDSTVKSPIVGHLTVPMWHHRDFIEIRHKATVMYLLNRISMQGSNENDMVLSMWRHLVNRPKHSQGSFTLVSQNHDHFRVIMIWVKNIKFWFIVMTVILVWPLCDFNATSHSLEVLLQ